MNLPFPRHWKSALRPKTNGCKMMTGPIHILLCIPMATTQPLKMRYSFFKKSLEKNRAIPKMKNSEIQLARDRVLERLKTEDCVCREEFLVDAPNWSRARNKQLRVLNTVFQQLVVEGVLFTVDRSGDYKFFQHRGRAFPKLWKRRKPVD